MSLFIENFIKILSKLLKQVLIFCLILIIVFIISISPKSLVGTALSERCIMFLMHLKMFFKFFIDLYCEIKSHSLMLESSIENFQKFQYIKETDIKAKMNYMLKIQSKSHEDLIFEIIESNKEFIKDMQNLHNNKIFHLENVLLHKSRQNYNLINLNQELLLFFIEKHKLKDSQSLHLCVEILQNAKYVYDFLKH